ncbi:MAG TPA: 5,6-dimethylbenzimidazole synthase, partial [Burkholderiaceae bacterium]
MDEFAPTRIETLYQQGIAARPDMRHFCSDPLDEALMARLLQAAHCAPGVGYVQPWRFIRVGSAELRSQMLALVETERLETAKALGERQQEFLRLKVEGMRECAEILVAARCDKREQHVFGRRTIPDMDLASVACAIQNMWLAARVENVGMGWVSMFDPEALRELLRMPQGSLPVAILCLGRVDEFYQRPMLETQGWRAPDDLSDLVFDDYWGVGGGG